MDKRTLLAFFLMLVVLLVWSRIYSPTKPPADATDEVAQQSVNPGSGDPTSDADAPPTTSAPNGIPGSIDTTANQNDSNNDRESEVVPPPATPAAAAGGWLDLASDADGPVIEIENDHFVAQLDLVGADLRGWRMKEYKVKDENREVQLVNGRALWGAASAHALRLALEDRAWDLDRVRFTASGVDLVATGDSGSPYRVSLNRDHPEAGFELTAHREGGHVLRLVFQFDNETTAFSVRATYEGGGDAGRLARLGISWPGGIASTEPDTAQDFAEFKSFARIGADLHKKKFDNLRKGDGSKGREEFNGSVAYAGVMSKYFTVIVQEDQVRKGQVRLDGDHALRLQTFALSLPLQGAESSGLNYNVYLGPLDYDQLNALDPAATSLIDMGPTFFRPVSRATLWVLIFLYGFIPNYGVVIILLSAATKFLFYPLTKSSTRSMREMQLIQPEMQKIREKHKDDQKKQSEAMMALYKEHKINPLGGCLPLLVQMPVFIALFQVLRKTIELRQAPFVGWITDLSQPDVLFTLPFSLPVLGSNFCILPFLMAGGMWLQTKIGAMGAPPQTGGGAMAAQTRMMSTMMPIMMFFIFYNSPSGLTLYWTVNTLLTIGQTWQIHRTAPSKLQPQPA